MKQTVNKLYAFIAKLMIMLENDLNEAEENGESKTKITATLNKLVTLIIQINKLSRDELVNTEPIMLNEDKEIIEQFLKKYKLEK